MKINKKKFEEKGFIGFIRISELKTNYNILPKKKGIYLILMDANEHGFLKVSTGGHFKNKNPAVNINKLQAKWVKGTPILYIGKAGGSNLKATLQSRLKQYMQYGIGKKIGHQGGRYIWQLRDSDNFIVAWKTLENEEPEDIETKMIVEFKDKHGKLPFANLKK